ncbi:GNAT family N-acetyltransferase [Radiobacillus sp. PE A8.2]|uniref:GNAT family N-acetyltransferase n=1 Tax=Radiobacillus sp. PE A8.2 TaxID=3380349 RepID=UPI00388D0704
MTFKLATAEDAPIIHQLMIDAFAIYNQTIPSNALEETVQSIQFAMETDGERAVICYDKHQPIAMARFTVKYDSLYFYRLSVLPSYHGKGNAKKVITWLETYAQERACKRIWCKVRKSVQQNLYLYRSLGYKIFNEFIVTKEDGTQLDVVSMEKFLLHSE